ncbi:hypothetical protein [Ornithinimicrobium cerasi]|uniref:Uncharacterized protein n=1 Tax=Ornithinimicrobium cerasi TaxID=2248773 RepID=A0A285VRA7_9MICO|nr:hypothetical protein [Ornithinimicrobium cerasi]SOC56585.1 hypothetical protein SAMN05421879_10845 [Ornithinimicrobium cerasi]
MTDSDRSPEEEALARAVHTVYGAPPEEFVAVRKEQVARLRAEGLRDQAKQVGALRKPSVSAAAVNALVRSDDPVVASLHDVGARMRHAQSALDMAALAGLRAERDTLLAAWVAAARTRAPGGSLTPAVESEVRDTAVAALADAGAAAVVTSGNLTRALSYSGFGEVDVADAVARTSTGVVLTRFEGGRRADPDKRMVGESDAQERAGRSAGEPDRAEEAGEPGDGEEPYEGEAAGEADDGEADEEPATPPDRVSELEMELDEAEKVVAAARATRRSAAQADADAEQEVTVAQEQVAQAERLLASARKRLEKAHSRRSQTETALEAADRELVESRARRDEMRAALEEAEDA